MNDDSCPHCGSEDLQETPAGMACCACGVLVDEYDDEAEGPRAYSPAMDAKALLEALEAAIPGPKIVLTLLDGKLQVVVSDQPFGKWDSWFLDDEDHARPPADVAADIATAYAERVRART